MMTGGSIAHARIRDNIVAALRRRLRGGPCDAFGEGVKVTTETVSAYPDAYVLCGPVDLRRDIAPPPVFIAEVLSRTTQDYDRGSKWLGYQTIPELRHYALVSQDERRIDLFSRAERGWIMITLRSADTLELPDLGVTLPLEEVYEDSGIEG